MFRFLSFSAGEFQPMTVQGHGLKGKVSKAKAGGGSPALQGNETRGVRLEGVAS